MDMIWLGFGAAFFAVSYVIVHFFALLTAED